MINKDETASVIDIVFNNFERNLLRYDSATSLHVLEGILTLYKEMKISMFFTTEGLSAVHKKMEVYNLSDFIISLTERVILECRFNDINFVNIADDMMKSIFLSHQSSELFFGSVSQKDKLQTSKDFFNKDIDDQIHMFMLYFVLLFAEHSASIYKLLVAKETK